jgi:hypothetical protein
MTKKYSEINDNNGICESCNNPKQKGAPQSAYPVLLGGELGWGTMWLCDNCYREHKKRDKR